MEDCLNQVNSVLLQALEIHEVFRLLRCSRFTRKIISSSHYWRHVTTEYGFDKGTIGSIRLMRDVLHRGPDSLCGQQVKLEYEFPETMGTIHLNNDILTFITRQGKMWRLNMDNHTAKCICSVGRCITHSKVDPTTGNLLTQGIYHSSVHTPEGTLVDPVQFSWHTEVPTGTFAALPHVIPSHNGTYMSKLNGNEATFDKALFYIPRNDTKHIVITRCLMPYVRPALVTGGIMYASVNRVYAWNEDAQCSIPIVLPRLGMEGPRAILTTALGKPVVITGGHIYILQPQSPYKCRIACPLPRTLNVFSTPQVLGELVVGYHTSDPNNRWIVDAITGRRCVHPRMRLFHGVLHRDRCISHVMGTGINIVQTST